VAVYGDRWRKEWILGFFLMSSLATALLLARAARGFRVRILSKGFLALLLIDVSTNAFWWVRTVAVPLTFKQPPTSFIPNPSPVKGDGGGGYSETTLVHQAVLRA